MKVFLPMTDELLRNVDALMQSRMVPFNPEFLRVRSSRAGEGARPDDWLSDDDYASACERLRATVIAEIDS